MNTMSWTTPATRLAQKAIIRETVLQLPDVLIDLITEYDVFAPKRGDVVDVLDQVSEWMCGRVLDIKDKQTYLISYIGWSSQWDEWISMKSGRLTPVNVHDYYCREPSLHPRYDEFVTNLIQDCGLKEWEAHFMCQHQQNWGRPLTLSNLKELVQEYQTTGHLIEDSHIINVRKSVP